MKEITQQVREQIFALYRGSDAIAIHPPKDHGYPFDENERGLKVAGVLNGRIIIQRIAEDVEDIFNQCALHLIALEDISDEHSLAINELFLKMTSTLTAKDVKVILLVMFGHIDPQTQRSLHQQFLPSVLPSEFSAIIDFLRKIGVATPYLHWSVSDLVSAGVYKLKTK